MSRPAGNGTRRSGMIRCAPALDRGGTTVLRVENGKIAEEIGLDDGVTALQQLGILKVA
jgi:hypothetical protein